MIILCLDCATETGWAVFDSECGLVRSGTKDFTKKRGETNGILFLRFNKWLNDTISDYKPSILCYEQAHHRGGAATEIGVGLATRVMEAAAANDIEAATVHTSTLKKHATGNGRAGKDAMIARAKEILGCDPVDDNEADAVCIAMWAKDEFVI